MEGKRQKQILPIILNRDILELEALILATQALTFRFKKKKGPGTETTLVCFL